MTGNETDLYDFFPSEAAQGVDMSGLLRLRDDRAGAPAASRVPFGPLPEMR
jgi:hypothetical protein